MSRENKYDHYHEKSSEWFKKAFLDGSKGIDKDHREVHHHKIVDKVTGRTGEGWGWSYQEAEKQAWSSLNRINRSS
jgi:hypothetical protein